MKLSTYSDYAMRVMIYLVAKDGTLTSIRQVATIYDISQNHLMKVVQNLAGAGFIEAVRGRNGGIRLASPPIRSTSGRSSATRKSLRTSSSATDA